MEESILDAGLEVFLTKGYACATEDVIADTAGINNNELKAHFGTKEALFCMVVDREITRSRIAYADGIPKFDNAMDALMFAARSHVEAMRETKIPNLLKAAVTESKRFPQLITFFQSQSGGNLLVTFTEHIMQSWIDDGLFKPCDTRVAANQFLGMIHQGFFHDPNITGHLMDNPDEYLESCCQLLHDAYAA
ncbi:MAG: TetR/AcrR family transcriptional regulator [Woeseiaceae bacterium]